MILWSHFKLSHKGHLRITKTSQLKNLPNNTFIGNLPKMINSKITFKGINNILYCDPNVTLENSRLHFEGNNSIIYLKSSHYKINLTLFNNSAIHIGSNNYFNKVCQIICSEHKHIFIGNSNLFSINVFFRNADPHLIYDIKSKNRINPTQSIYIGDHVWIGQNCLLLKGSKIHSGSILGAGSILTKEMVSNSIYAGVPAKCVKKDIFWQGECVHAWTHEDTQKYKCSNTNDFIYTDNPKEYISFEQIDEALNGLDVQGKLKYLHVLNSSEKKNRFSKKN